MGPDDGAGCLGGGKLLRGSGYCCIYYSGNHYAGRVEYRGIETGCTECFGMEEKMGFIIGLAFLTFALWIGFKLTGALLSAAIWLLIKIPLAMVFLVLGLVFCCTIILIPVGLCFLKLGIRFFVPGSFAF